MQRIAYHSLLAVLFLLLPFRSPAQEDKPFQMPCAQVLKLGLDKFVEVYVKQQRDDSEAGQDNAYDFYYECKRKRNDALAKRHSPETLKRLQKAREALSHWADSFAEYLYVMNGGGTIITHTQERAYGVREDVAIPSLLAALKKPAAQPTARKKANDTLAKLQRKAANPPKPQPGIITTPEDKKRLAGARAELQQEFTRLQTVARSLPDEAALQLAEAALHAAEDFTGLVEP